MGCGTSTSPPADEETAAPAAVPASTTTATEAPATAATLTDGACKLRIIHVNDVYELDMLPNLATAIKQESAGQHTIALLPGDFLAPSLLSSIDGCRCLDVYDL